MPDWTPELRRRLAGLRLDPAREAEIVEEMGAHLDLRFAELTRGGVSSEVAVARALDELGPPEAMATNLRRLRQAHAPPPLTMGAPRRRLLADIWQDLRHAARLIRAQPGFAAAAVLTLGLGIGANTAIFSVVNAVLFQPLPVEPRDRLVYAHNGRVRSVFSYPDFADLRARNDVFDRFEAWGPIAASLNAGGRTELVSGAIVTGGYFETLGVLPHLGRVIGGSDDRTPMSHPVVVLGHGLWRRRFGGREDIVGQTIVLNGHPFTVIGVADRRFTGVQPGARPDVFVPMAMQPLMRPPRAGYSGEQNPSLFQNRDNSWLYTVGRLRDGVTPAQAEAALSVTATALARELQPSRPADAAPRRVPLTSIDVGDPAARAELVSAAGLLSAIVGAVLLIACANVANLLLSRAASRQREVAVRLAIGASRGRIVRQMVTESVLLAALGGAVGAALAAGVVQAFRSFPPPPGALPVAIEFSLDVRVVVFAAVLSFVTGVLFGIGPALHASRPRLATALTGTADVPPRWRWRRFGIRRVLVVVQVALSLLLIVAAGLFMRSLAATMAVNPGFDVDRLLSAPLSVNLLRYTSAQGRAFYVDVVAAVERIPGVESASIARVPLVGGGGRTVSVLREGAADSGNRLVSEGGIAPDGAANVAANVVGPGFFRTIGITFVKGRDFSAADAPQAPPVAIVNERFVAVQWPNADPIGRRISFRGADGPWVEIVGVVRDSVYATLNERPQPIVYVPLSQNHETGVTLYVRALGDPSALAGPVRGAIQALEPNLPVSSTPRVTDTVAASVYTARAGAWSIATLGGLALALAAVGLYGVLAFSIARRTRELGVRVALGAGRRQVYLLVIGEGMWLVAAGAAIGLATALFGVRSIAGFLYGIDALDPVTFVAGPLVLGATGLLACLIPARRAARVDPLEALRAS